MTGLLILLLILAIVNIVMAVNGRSDIGQLRNIVTSLTNEITALRKEVRRYRDEKPASDVIVPPLPIPSPAPDTKQAVAKESVNDAMPEVVPPPSVIIPVITEQEKDTVPQTEIEQELQLSVEHVAEEGKDAPVLESPVTDNYRKAAYEPEPQEGWSQRWARNNPDLEKFIGENLINKIGIAVLVLGIAFFVKYAIDQNWINEVGRVCIGMGCGIILVGLAHYMRNTYRSFSSVLAGGGIAVFYFTIAFAFHQYQLMSQTAAFVVMVIITAFAVALSVLYDKLELAVIAAIGGFLTPFLLSTGEGNYIILFTYLIILNVGLLSLAWFKRWPVINTIALAFTVLIYGVWYIDSIVESKPISYTTALLFLTVFYLIFLGMNMIYQVRMQQQFRRFDFFILLFISICYYAAGMSLLRHINDGGYAGLFTLGISMINLGLAYYVHRRGDTDKNLLFLLIGLALTFITLTIPVQLQGHAITMFWCAEFVLLYWLAQYSGISLFRRASMLICGLSFISLLMDWSKAADSCFGVITLMYADFTGLVTNIVAALAFGAYYALMRRTGEGSYMPGMSNTYAGRVSLFIAIGILYLTCIFGVNLLLRNVNTYTLPNVYHRIITYLFALVLLYTAQRRSKVRPVLFALPLLASFMYYLVSIGFIVSLRAGVFFGHYPLSAYMAHLGSDAALIALFIATTSAIRRNADTLKPQLQLFSVLICVGGLLFLSVEIRQAYILLFRGAANALIAARQYDKAGVTVLWALSSFIIMWLGMKHSSKVLRIISLVLFSVVLIKLFLFDISGISEGGKILAFILLGVLLLTVSFMYQRLKRIIFDDAAKDK
jgi:uncharacterized membrane protein